MITYAVYRIHRKNKKRNLPNNRLSNAIAFIAGICVDVVLLFIFCDIYGIWSWVR